MAAQAATANRTTQESAAERMQKLREAYADAPEVGRVALDKVRDELEAAMRLQQQQEVSTAGRIGLRRGKVSELFRTGEWICRRADRRSGSFGWFPRSASPLGLLLSANGCREGRRVC